MGHDFSRPDAPARTKLKAPDDWELQILETLHWDSDSGKLRPCFTAILLCPDRENMPEITDHLQYEFYDTTWTSTRLEQGNERVNQLIAALPCNHTDFPLVIHLGRVPADTAVEIERAVQQLKHTHPHVCVVVCCDDPDLREIVQSAYGFVCHWLQTHSHEALHFAAMLHGAFASPVSYTGCDLEDAKLVLGTAIQPAILGEAICWHGTDQLVICPQMPLEVWSQVASVFAVCFVSDYHPLKTSKKMFTLLRKLLGPNMQMHIAHSPNFQRSGLSQAYMDRVCFFLCRS